MAHEGRDGGGTTRHASDAPAAGSEAPSPQPQNPPLSASRGREVLAAEFKNAELVPDSAGMRMYVRTARLKQVRVDSEILVMFRPDNGFFGGVREGLERKKVQMR
jgi:hypothetical protein